MSENIEINVEDKNNNDNNLVRTLKSMLKIRTTMKMSTTENSEDKTRQRRQSMKTIEIAVTMRPASADDTHLKVYNTIRKVCLGTRAFWGRRLGGISFRVH